MKAFTKGLAVIGSTLAVAGGTEAMMQTIPECHVKRQTPHGEVVMPKMATTFENVTIEVLVGGFALTVFGGLAAASEGLIDVDLLW